MGRKRGLAREPPPSRGEPYRSSKTGLEERADSSFELRRFVALDGSDLVKAWTKRHGIVIPYRMGNKRRRYHPDILIQYHDGRRVLEEIKGFVFQPRQFSAKNFAAVRHCVMNGMGFRVVYGKDLETVD